MGCRFGQFQPSGFGFHFKFMPAFGLWDVSRVAGLAYFCVQISGYFTKNPHFLVYRVIKPMRSKELYSNALNNAQRESMKTKIPAVITYWRKDLRKCKIFVQKWRFCKDRSGLMGSSVPQGPPLLEYRMDLLGSKETEAFSRPSLCFYAMGITMQWDSGWVLELII